MHHEAQTRTARERIIAAEVRKLELRQAREARRRVAEAGRERAGRSSPHR